MVTEFVTRQLAPVVAGSMPTNEIFPLLKLRGMVRISTLSSKSLRLNSLEQESNIICVYKQDLILNPGEVKCWTRRIKKLTRVRHKNIIMRVALTIENILGTQDNQSKIELALSAELLHRLAAFGNNDYCPNLMVKMVIRTIGHCEELELELQRRFKEMMRDI